MQSFTKVFEVSGDDIVALSDADLRSLIARLAAAEVRANGGPLSSVTAGGNQDATDGGIDVRVDCPLEPSRPDFVPCSRTGFQVKKSDMPAAAIGREMRPGGVLRPVIRELAERSGAYVIVSAQGSVADRPLAERRAAMRDALGDLPGAAQLHTDFYDRDRVAAWTNEHLGDAAWVLAKTGRQFSGWVSVDHWAGDREAEAFLFDEKACLIDESNAAREHLTIPDGIARLRAALHEPTRCIRLIGLSGLGKTRLVQALFEPDIGENALDPSLAVYTDYSTETNPMARGLVARGRRAILVVDNCNPVTHTQLARLCAAGTSQVSLLTIEYDVRDDEPEHTEVFRLQSASPELVAAWIERTFRNVSQVDRERIAEFSDGNFRVTRALAETLGKGETLGRLKSQELFARIFQQRHSHDRQLFRAAENLALFYSIDGEDTGGEGELARAGATSHLGVEQLYEALVEMRRRGVVQARGRFRAILPQALANPLAALALERIPPADFDRFSAGLPSRMLSSLARRIGLLHDSPAAQAVVARWLRPDGALGDLVEVDGGDLQTLTHLAPIAPAAVLTRLGQKLDGPDGHRVLDDPRRHPAWIRLVKALGYDPGLFEAAVTILARFLVADPRDSNEGVAHSAFSEFFHLHLSGTRAAPEQRRAVARRFARSDDPGLRRCARVALEALLEGSRFASMHHFDFGARSRDWGWQPKWRREVCEWYEEAVRLVIEHAPEHARELLARHARELWHYPACRDALERAATAFVQERPWIEGWSALQTSLRYDGKDMPEEMRDRLKRIIDRLKPTGLLHRARAVILDRARSGWSVFAEEGDEGDASKGWERAGQMAQEIGRALAHDGDVRAEFLGELLVEPRAPWATECGRGLAEGSDNLAASWHELVEAFEASKPVGRCASVLAGFLQEAHRRDDRFTSDALEAAMDQPCLASVLASLQGHVGLDEVGIERLRRAIGRGVLTADDLRPMAHGRVMASPPEPLAALLEDVAALPGGVAVALDILQIYFCKDRAAGHEHGVRLLAVGRELLTRAVFSRGPTSHDLSVDTVIRICLAGEEGQQVTEAICAEVLSSVEVSPLFSHDLTSLLSALLQAQPFLALDAFLLRATPRFRHRVFRPDAHTSNPLDGVASAILQEWANRDPDTRYPLLGSCLSMFGQTEGGEDGGFSRRFLSVLNLAPDKRRFLGNLYDHLQPQSWCGSLADVLVARWAQLTAFAVQGDPQVQTWVADNLPELDRWIEQERGQERASEESFE